MPTLINGHYRAVRSNRKISKELNQIKQHDGLYEGSARSTQPNRENKLFGRKTLFLNIVSFKVNILFSSDIE